MTLISEYIKSSPRSLERICNLNKTRNYQKQIKAICDINELYKSLISPIKANLPFYVTIKIFEPPNTICIKVNLMDIPFFIVLKNFIIC